MKQAIQYMKPEGLRRSYFLKLTSYFDRIVCKFATW
jgi:hypothetical protein